MIGSCTGKTARRGALGSIAILIGLLLSGFGLSASAGEVNTGHFGRVAIMGYDTVAYFTMSEAVKGSETHSENWLGATWLFVSEDHRKAFREDPLSYAPQYGGHCALGVASGSVARGIDPEAWSIIDGKLYLNYSKSVREAFDRDSANLIRTADERWEGVKKKATQ